MKVLALLIVLALYYGLYLLAYGLLCWCFGVVFSFKVALGIFLVVSLVRGMLSKK